MGNIMEALQVWYHFVLDGLLEWMGCLGYLECLLENYQNELDWMDSMMVTATMH